MATKQKKSDALAAKIKALEAELEAAQRAESEAADAELIRLVHRAGATEELTKLMRQRLDHKAAE